MQTESDLRNYLRLSKQADALRKKIVEFTHPFRSPVMSHSPKGSGNSWTDIVDAKIDMQADYARLVSEADAAYLVLRRFINEQVQIDMQRIFEARLIFGHSWSRIAEGGGMDTTWQWAIISKRYYAELKRIGIVRTGNGGCK